jgi:hypothetical protein
MRDSRAMWARFVGAGLAMAGNREAPRPAADLEFLNREAGAFLTAVTDSGKKLD